RRVVGERRSAELDEAGPRGAVRQDAPFAGLARGDQDAVIDPQGRQRLGLVGEVRPNTAPALRPELGDVEHLRNASAAGGLRIHGAFMPAPRPKLKARRPGSVGSTGGPMSRVARELRGTIVAMVPRRAWGARVAPRFSGGVAPACASCRAPFPGWAMVRAGGGRE